jgi:hypothetical protein
VYTVQSKTYANLQRIAASIATARAARGLTRQTVVLP